MAVLILTDGADPAADRVAAELAGRGVPVTSIDPADFPRRLSMAAAIVPFEAWSGVIDGEADIDLGAVRAVYYGKPTQFSLPGRMSGAERVFAYGEARRGFGGVLPIWTMRHSAVLLSCCRQRSSARQRRGRSSSGMPC